MVEFIVMEGYEWWAARNDIKEAMAVAKERAQESGNDVVIYKAFRVAKPVTKVEVEEFKPYKSGE